MTIPAKRAGSKDDARDAGGLADDLRTKTNLRPVYKGVGPFSELRARGSELSGSAPGCDADQ